MNTSENNPESPSPVFSTADHLKAREEKPDFLMVEIGHGAKPAAFSGTNSFEGQRAYIGIESWQRDPAGIRQETLQERHAGRKDENIFFIGYPKDYTGGASLLPEGIADEVLIANVLGDYLAASTHAEFLDIASRRGKHGAARY
jgi:hypothetical protein